MSEKYVFIELTAKNGSVAVSRSGVIDDAAISDLDPLEADAYRVIMLKGHGGSGQGVPAEAFQSAFEAIQSEEVLVEARRLSGRPQNGALVEVNWDGAGARLGIGRLLAGYARRSGKFTRRLLKAKSAGRGRKWLLVEAGSSSPTEMLSREASLGQEDYPVAPESGFPPPPKDSEASMLRRRNLIREEGWLTAVQVASCLQYSDKSAKQAVSKLRRQHKLLGAWVKDERAFRFPKFQFSDAEILPEIRLLLGILPEGNGTGWAQVQWFYSRHAQLDGETPRSVMLRDPERVLAVAKRQFKEDADAFW
ncbi:TPA: hypothetical protein QEK28_001967 [Stenotrophomonas maltophilia]|nr:hypothetical protein [Stenotrophomonas maltophilia]